MVFAANHADENANSSRYVPLNDLQERFGALTGTPQQPASARGAAVTSKVSRTSSVDTRQQAGGGRGRRFRKVQEPPKSGTLELVRSSPAYAASVADVVQGDRLNDEGSQESSGEAAADAEIMKQDNETHEQCISWLGELQFLETELMLNFQSVKTITREASRFQPQPAVRPGSPATQDKGNKDGKDGDAEEIIIELELTGSHYATSGAKTKRAQGLSLRSPWMWELHLQPGRPCSRQAPEFVKIESDARCDSRPETPAKSWMGRSNPCTRPNSAASTTASIFGDIAPYDADALPPSAWRYGDSSHHLNLDLVERTPEALVLRRVKPQGKSETVGVSMPPVVHRRKTSLVACQNQGTALADAIDAPMISKEVEAAARKLEMFFRPKLKEQVTSGPAEAAEPPKPSNWPKEPQVKGYRTRAQHHMRDFRSALRIIGPLCPPAARVLDGAVKGVLLAIDMEMTLARQTALALETKVAELETAKFEMESLRTQAGFLRNTNNRLKEKLKRQEEQFAAADTAHRKCIISLSDELKRVTPDTHELEGVGRLMLDYGRLMDDFEEETAKQERILKNLSTYTGAIAGDAQARDTEQVTRGRIIEMANGEIELRPHDVNEQGVQVTAADMMQKDGVASEPVRIRSSKVREILAMFEGQSLPDISFESLCVDVERLLCAKITVDAEADHHGWPRRDLIDFCVDFYVEELDSYSQAQQQICAILRCLLKAESLPAGTAPLKVLLFARLLEFAELEKAVPVSVLSIVLRAKRLAQPSYLNENENLSRASVRLPKAGDIDKSVKGGLLQKGKADKSEKGGSGALRADTANLVPAGGHSQYTDPQLPAAAAYSAALAAIPPGYCREALKVLFIQMANSAEVEGVEVRRSKTRDFVFFLHVAHEQLQQQSAPVLRDLIHRAEQRVPILIEDFRQALADIRLHAIEESVWKDRLADKNDKKSELLSQEQFLEYFGGGAGNRLPRAFVVESGMLTAVTDAVHADYAERSKNLRRNWERHIQDNPHDSLDFKDIRALLLSADPDLTPTELRTLYISAVEFSRACSQVQGGVFPVFGTVESVADEYGGDLVMWQHLRYVAQRSGLFIQEPNGHGKGQQQQEKPTRQGNSQPTRQTTVVQSPAGKRGTTSPASLPQSGRKSTRKVV